MYKYVRWLAFFALCEAVNDSCPLHLSIPLPHHEVQIYENKSVKHDGILYPQEKYFYDDDNLLRGCVCDLTKCVRKCCPKNQVLTNNSSPFCTQMQEDITVPDLHLPMERLSSRLRNVSMSDHFKFVFSRECPAKRMVLDPTNYQEDRFELQEDGRLLLNSSFLKYHDYCIDWDQSLEEISVVVCLPKAEPPVTYKLYSTGMLISIPFLTATLFVYAIIPELRNIYGRTLMCYVSSLISAYCFLVINNFFYLYQLCVGLESCPVGESCVSVCCDPGEYFDGSVCVNLETHANTSIPLYDENFNLSQKTSNDLRPIYGYPCNPILKSYFLTVGPSNEEEWSYLLENGKLHNMYLKYNVSWFVDKYCIGTYKKNLKNGVFVCFPEQPPPKTNVSLLYPISLLLSLPFLLLTFVVYTILPDLNNLHGSTLRAYIAMLSLAYFFLAIIQLFKNIIELRHLCKTLAFIIHFSFLASFFWLNVMCFDIWWTFGGFRTLQGSVRQRERKKFIIYSIYAWGCASVLTGVCIIMDLAPNIPNHFIKPQFASDSCWFTTEKAKALYFYGPMGVTVLCNIYLFISTAYKIVQHKKDTALQLKGSESRRHDDNKQWFNLYLKLFIVMGINWSMELVSWFFQNLPGWVWYITDLTNTLQGVIIFVIFVCKGKIKRLLLKRLGFEERSYASRNSTRSGTNHSSASRTGTTIFPMQEKSTSAIVDSTLRTKPSTIEQTECN